MCESPSLNSGGITYVMVIPEDACSTMNADWHRASINYALQNVALVTKTAEVVAALG